MNEYEPFVFEWLKEKPLLEFEQGRYICLSLFYLIYSMSRGISGRLRRIMGEEYGDKASEYLAKSYEDYIHTLMEKAYTRTDRFFHTSFNGIEITDGIIDYGDKLICIEVKSGAIEKRYSISNKYRDIELALNPFFVKKGASQLDKRIDDIRSERVKIKCIDPHIIKRYYPVLIMCSDPLPMYNILTGQYYNILKNNNILQKPYIAPLTILDIEEFEVIMELVEQRGISFIDLIDKKLNDPSTVEWSFKNFIIEKERLPYERTKQLNQVLETLLQQIKKEFGFKEPRMKPE
jgi:hypothetical protein